MGIRFGAVYDIDRDLIYEVGNRTLTGNWLALRDFGHDGMI